MVGLLGIPILDTLRREPIIQDPLSWLAQIGDAIAQGWTWIRCNPVVWFVTEVIRRIVLVAWGLVYFVGSTIWSVVKLLGSLAMGLANLVWGNIKSVWQFATGSNEIRRDMLVGFRDRWFTKDAWIERWESAEFFGAMFVTSIVDTWKRWWHGLGRAFTDPDMSNEDLIQLGEDTGSVVCDALIVAEGAGAVVRAVRGASWFGRVGELSEFGKLGRAGQLAEAYRIAGVLSDAGYRSITAYRVWRVMQAAEREVEFAKLLSQLPKSHHNTIMALIEQGYLQWEGSKLKGVSGTIKPWKLAKALASGQARDVEQLMHQIEGGLGQTVVREFMTKEVGFRHFILDFRNPSATGLDALAQYSDSIVAVEVKNLSRTVGANEISKYLTVRDGVAKFEVKDLLNEIGRRAGLSAQLNAAQAIQNGTFVFRIELVGTAPTKATADLMAMNGKVVDGVKIIVLPR